MAAGVDGLLRDKTRPSRIPSLEPDVAERVVALTLTPVLCAMILKNTHGKPKRRTPVSILSGYTP